MAKKQAVAAVAARHYDVIVAPHITEKGDIGLREQRGCF